MMTEKEKAMLFEKLLYSSTLGYNLISIEQIVLEVPNAIFSKQDVGYNLDLFLRRYQHIQESNYTYLGLTEFIFNLFQYDKNQTTISMMVENEKYFYVAYFICDEYDIPFKLIGIINYEKNMTNPKKILQRIKTNQNHKLFILNSDIPKNIMNSDMALLNKNVKENANSEYLGKLFSVDFYLCDKYEAPFCFSQFEDLKKKNKRVLKLLKTHKTFTNEEKSLLLLSAYGLVGVPYYLRNELATRICESPKHSMKVSLSREEQNSLSVLKYTPNQTI